MDIIETRRENLRRWIAEHGTPAKERSLFSQLKADGSFGERVARRLEEQYRMGAGYLDRDLEGDKLQPKVKESQGAANDGAGADELLARAVELLETYRSAGPADRDRIDRLVRNIRDRMGAVDKAKPSAS